MNKYPEWNKKMEEILESLDGIKRAEAGAFFFTRVKARLQREERDTLWDLIGSLLSRPAVAFASLFLVLFINAGVFYEKSHESGMNASNPNASVNLDDEDYNIGIATLYEYNNN